MRGSGKKSGERSAMRLGDLPAERQTDSGAVGLGREERDEQVRRGGDTRTFVFHPDFDAAVPSPPADPDTAAGLEGCIRSVLDEIDQELVELVVVGFDLDRLTLDHDYREACFEAGDAMHPLADLERLPIRWREPGHPRIR